MISTKISLSQASPFPTLFGPPPSVVLQGRFMICLLSSVNGKLNYTHLTTPRCNCLYTVNIYKIQYKLPSPQKLPPTLVIVDSRHDPRTLVMFTPSHTYAKLTVKGLFCWAGVLSRCQVGWNKGKQLMDRRSSTITTTTTDTTCLHPSS